MRGRTYQEKAYYWITADRMPLTKLIIVVNIITFLLINFKAYKVAAYLVFSTNIAKYMPWTAFTYPLVTICGGTLCTISAIFSFWWLWFVGSNLERVWGTLRYGLFFFIMSAISAGGLYLGTQLTGISVITHGLWLPLAGLTVVFAMRNPEETVFFNIIIPLKLKYLALLDVVFVVITYGRAHILIGLLGLTGCAFSYWYVNRSRISFSPVSKKERKGEVVHLFQKRSPFNYLNPIKWLKERRDRKKLKKLFERSDL